MASIINASTAGVGGVITTADNTGILNIQTAGTTAITVNASQNVGIGTATPTRLLDVSNTTGDATVAITSSTTGQSSLWFADTDTNIGGLYYEHTNNAMGFRTNDVERMRIDSSGNLGLGVTPSAWGSNISKVVEMANGVSLAAFQTAGIASSYLTTNAYNDGTNWRYKVGFASSQYQQVGNSHIWFTAPSGTAGNAITFTQAMTLDASGNLMVGATGNAGTGAIVYANGTFAGTGYNTRTGIGGSFTGNSFNINWTGSVAELYIATTKVVANLSDYRFKKNIVSQTDNAISKVMNLRPVVYELADNGIYKADGIVREGFIAHELAEIIPSAVEGAKDQVDEEGKDIPQGLKLDAIVSVLTKSIQEQQVMIQELKAEIDLLKGVK
jgi:hypothetical protein